MYTEPILGDEAFKQMKEGIDSLANTVRLTMGVRGKSISLDTNEYGRFIDTNDGATIARNFKAKGRAQNNGVKRTREVAEKTNDTAGDGTSTSIVLYQSIIDQGLKAISAGADGIAMREGINNAVSNIIAHIESEKLPADTHKALKDVATISSRDSKIGDLIATVVMKAGLDGVITIEDRAESDTIYEAIEGLKLRGGFISDFFVNLPQGRQTVFADVPVLVTNRNITTAAEMGKIMDTVSDMGKKEAVLIANGVDGDALATSMVNWKNKAIYILPLRVMTYGEAGEGALKDVAAVTGATYLDENEKNIMDITVEDFGRAAKTVTDRHNTTVISNVNELKKARIKQLESSLIDAKEFEAESIRERIAKLKSAMFNIKVGGQTDTEREELKTRVDDAVKAARAAFAEGTVAGGGSSLYRAVQAQKRPDITTDEGIGEQVVYQAALAPIKQLAINSGYTLDKGDLELIIDKNKAINLKTCKVVNAYKDGILDPVLVVKQCVQNAASGAASFLTLGGLVVVHQLEKEETI